MAELSWIEHTINFMKSKQKIIFFGCIIFVNLFVALQTHAAVLFDFNESGANGTTWPGWTWIDRNVVNPLLPPPDNLGVTGYGPAGWTNDSGALVPGTASWFPRVFGKTDYGNINDAIIDISQRAPGTSNGGTLKVYDNGESSIYQSGWWFQHAYNYGTLSLANDASNRLNFYFKPEFTADSGLTSDPDNGNTHVGTYLCWPGGALGGEGCPTEAANQHYYHYLTVNPGAWLHVQLDRHPTHQRGMSGAGEPEDDPAFALYGKHYYESMNSFYVEIRYAQSAPTSYLIDEMEVWTQAENQNEISIASVWAGYWEQTGKWEIGFNDNSFNETGYNSTSQSTFEVRWSILPITNDNYAAASIVEPEYWERTTTNTFRRPNSWKKVAWTRFTLPTEIVENNEMVYFAIKDVSAVFNGDGHDAPSSLIKTIDYAIRPEDTDLTPPSAPGGLSVM